MGESIQKAVNDLGLALQLAFAPVSKAIEEVIRVFAERFGRPDTIKALIMLAQAELDDTPRWRLIRRHKLKQFIKSMELKRTDQDRRGEIIQNAVVGFNIGTAEAGVKTSPDLCEAKDCTAIATHFYSDNRFRLCYTHYSLKRPL